MQNFELLGKELERRGKTEAVKQLADSPVNPIPRKFADSVKEKLEQSKKMREEMEAAKKAAEEKKDSGEEAKPETEEKK